MSSHDSDLVSDPKPRSTGPKTPEGKARSSMNALKHGRYAKSASVISIEDDIAFRDLLAAYNDQFTPNTPVEARLVNEIAHIDWQLSRWRAIEIAHINRTYLLHDPSYTGQDFGLDQLQLLTAALEASINESRFPNFIHSRIAHLLTERNNAFRTLRALRRSNPSSGPQSLQLPADNKISEISDSAQNDPQPVDNTTTSEPTEPLKTN